MYILYLAFQKFWHLYLHVLKQICFIPPSLSHPSILTLSLILFGIKRSKFISFLPHSLLCLSFRRSYTATFLLIWSLFSPSEDRLYPPPTQRWLLFGAKKNLLALRAGSSHFTFLKLKTSAHNSYIYLSCVNLQLIFSYGINPSLYLIFIMSLIIYLI